MIIRKSTSELRKMRAGGELVRETLNELSELVKPGVTTLDLEVVAEKRVKQAGARGVQGILRPGRRQAFPDGSLYFDQ